MFTSSAWLCVLAFLHRLLCLTMSWTQDFLKKIDSCFKLRWFLLNSFGKCIFLEERYKKMQKFTKIEKFWSFWDLYIKSRNMSLMMHQQRVLRLFLMACAKLFSLKKQLISCFFKTVETWDPFHKFLGFLSSQNGWFFQFLFLRLNILLMFFLTKMFKDFLLSKNNPNVPYNVSPPPHPHHHIPYPPVCNHFPQDNH